MILLLENFTSPTNFVLKNQDNVHSSHCLIKNKALHCVKSDQMRENKDQNNSEYGHFSRSVYYDYTLFRLEKSKTRYAIY